MEELILELISPANQSSRERIHDLQRQIQLLQRQKSAWQIGLDFLKNDNAFIRFYGALTLTIKINTDWSEDGLSDNQETRMHLLGSLVNSYIQLTSLPDASFVLRKVCGTLSTFFLKAVAEWKLPVRSVLNSFLNGAYVSESFPEELKSSILMLNQLSYEQLRGLLWLCSDLAEDVGRLESGKPQGAKAVEKLGESGEDVWMIIYECLKTAFNGQPEVHGVSYINALSTSEHRNDILRLVLQIVPLWAPYAPSPESGYFRLEEVISLIVECFHVPDLTESTLQVLSSLLQASPRLPRNFRSASKDAVTSLPKSDRALDLLNSLAQGDFSPEGIQYVELLDVLVEEEFTSDNWPQSESLLGLFPQFRLLMTCPGIPVIEDEVCQPLIAILNKIFGEAQETPASNYNNSLKELALHVTNWSMVKLRYPIKELDGSTSTWDADERQKFRDFRDDVSEFLSSAYMLEGHDSHVIAKMAAAGILEIHTRSDWASLEAYLFSFYALLDFTSSETFDPFINMVFRSRMWNMTVQNTAEVPDQVRQTAIDFVSLNDAYLQRNPDTIVPCLNFLFSSLQSKRSATVAARAIHRLCSTQRLLFIEALPQLVASLQTVSTIEPSDRHKLYGSVAAVIQALPSEPEKVAPLSHMLDIVTAIGEQISDEEEEEFITATETLRALASIGKGLRAPEDAVVDLDAPRNEMANFWTSGQGYPIQQRVLTICTNALRVPDAEHSSELTEAACNLIKSGYPEQHPSPFKFSASLSIDFLSSLIKLDSVNIEAVMACASAFLASSDVEQLRNSLSALMAPLFIAYEDVFAGCQRGEVFTDGEFISSTFDFLSRMVPKWSQVWLSLPNSQQSLAVVVEIALVVIADPDTLPRRSAASLIAAIVDLSGPASPLPPPASSTLSTILQVYNPRILALLLKLLAGDCARSELEALTEPLKKFVQKQGAQVKALLREAMKEDVGVLSVKALKATTIEDRMRFVAQVEGLRGARTTNEVVREFWISSRGSSFAYIA